MGNKKADSDSQVLLCCSRDGFVCWKGETLRFLDFLPALVYQTKSKRTAVEPGLRNVNTSLHDWI
jgi:hypothetical protein